MLEYLRCGTEHSAWDVSSGSCSPQGADEWVLGYGEISMKDDTVFCGFHRCLPPALRKTLSRRPPGSGGAESTG